MRGLAWTALTLSLACGKSEPDAATRAEPSPEVTTENPPAPGLDMTRPNWGLSLAAVGGWTPAWDGTAVAFSREGAPVSIRARVIDGEAPARAEDVPSFPELVKLLGFTLLRGPMDTRSSTYSWSAVLEGQAGDDPLEVHVAVHRHGARSIICWAPVADAQTDAAIARDDAARVCATLATRAEVGDADADGLPDDKDSCPDIAEPRDGVDDADGCPDSRCEGKEACWKEGVEAYRAKDFARSFAAQQRGCAAGNGMSCSAVGDLYSNGHLRLDYERAVELYRAACDMKTPHGCNNLGWAMERGLGVKRDAAAAEAHYLRACELLPGAVACENADIMKARREGRE